LTQNPVIMHQPVFQIYLEVNNVSCIGTSAATREENEAFVGVIREDVSFLNKIDMKKDHPLGCSAATNKNFILFSAS
jgi:hypothetical protein